MSHQSGETPEPVYRQALEKFQYYAGLLVTGKMDSATEAKLTGPRCGAKDFKQIPNLRRKRFVKQGTTWKKMVLCCILDHGKYGLEQRFPKWGSRKILGGSRKILGGSRKILGGSRPKRGSRIVHEKNKYYKMKCLVLQISGHAT